MKKLILFSLFILLFNACASLLNKERTIVKFSADSNSKIIYQNDTLQVDRQQIKIEPKRSNRALKITVLKDNLNQDFYLESKLSSLFWANIFGNYGAGMLIDFSNNKRFTYQHNLHFVTDSVKQKIVLSNQKINAIPKNSVFLYTSPLQFLDFFNEPMATLGTEYFLRNNISVSGEYGFRNSAFNDREHNVTFLTEKASIFRVETKWYNVINFTKNVHSDEYLSIEYRQINSNYNDNINYYNRDNTIQYDFITDDFATKKTVSIINLKYGILVPLGKKMYFDFYSGFGIRTKKFDHINLEYNKQIHQINFSDDLSLFEIREFKDYNQKSFLNYSLGFKFGIKL
ncbi:hypothetical protein [Polaribacter sp. R77954]|uniref:hypothetical protein n=1 Tax=Polaribacter sp. R77954 TaxID=3093870 RepID=UPI0037C8ED94